MRGVASDVRFLGWVSAAELDGLYAAADCFVFPSLYEGFGLPVLEAMARGVPVAAPTGPRCRRWRATPRCSFDPEDPADIAAAIERAALGPTLRSALRASGRARAATFTWERTAELTVASYRRALASA